MLMGGGHVFLIGAISMLEGNHEAASYEFNNDYQKEAPHGSADRAGKHQQRSDEGKKGTDQSGSSIDKALDAGPDFDREGLLRPNLVQGFTGKRCTDVLDCGCSDYDP